jgi:hypothetical protein
MHFTRNVALTLVLLIPFALPTIVHAQTPVSWWKADGNAFDSSGGNNGILLGGVHYGPGVINQGFVFNGTNGVVDVPDSFSLEISGSVRITANLYVNQLPIGLGQIFLRGDDRPGLDPIDLSVDSSGNLLFHVADASNNDANISAPIPLRQWVSVDVSLDNATGQMQMIINHQVVSQMTTSIRPFPYLDQDQSPGIGIGNTQDPNSYNEPFNGTIDELKVYNTTVKTHELWRNTNGTASVWTINTDGTYTSQLYGPYDGWTPQQIAQGPDNTVRLLWTNSDGRATLWNLSDTNPASTAAVYGPFPGWKTTALTVGPDNAAHLLWNNTDGRVALWNTTDPNPVATAVVAGPYSGWAGVAIGIGSDNHERLLWDNTSGQVAVWNLSDANPSATAVMAGPYNGWTAKRLSVGEDNAAHLLWDNTSGQVAVWNLTDANPLATALVYGPYSDWSGQDLSVGADSKDRLLWDNVSGQNSLWNLSDANPLATYTLAGPYSGWTAVSIAAGQ